MGKSRYGNMRRIIIIGFLLFFVISGTFIIFETSAEDNGVDEEKEWRNNVTQTNDSWPILLSYEEMSVFFQNTWLECEISIHYTIAENMNLDNVTITLSVEKGGVAFHYYSFDYSNNNLTLLIIEDVEVHNEVYVKPDELDMNFNMSVNATVSNSTEVLYSETHMFWVVGEPYIEPGEDLNEDVDVMEIYSGALIVSVVFFSMIGGIHLLGWRNKGFT